MSEKKIGTGNFALSSLNGENGLVFSSNANNGFGSSAASGDFNCDGIGDFVIGAPSNPGAIYVIYGSSAMLFPTNIVAQNLNHTTGAIIYGVTSQDNFGSMISNAGDFNGDGCDDLIAGANTASPSGMQTAGQAYVIFGSNNITTPMSVGELNGKNGFAINGIRPLDHFGSSVSGMRGGDVNGDGIADIIIGAPGANNNAGQAFMLYGGKGDYIPVISAKNLNGTNGITFEAMTFGYGAGNSVSIGGDLNGDGLKDVIIAASQMNNGAGEVFLYYGAKNLPALVKLNNIGSNGVVISGAGSSATIGVYVGGVGDINGDSVDDLTITIAPVESQQYNILVYGNRDFPQNINCQFGATGLSVPGFIVAHELSYGSVQNSNIVGVGDFNQDGISDALMSMARFVYSSGWNEFNSAGAVIYGNSTRFNNDIDVGNLQDNGLVLYSAWDGYSMQPQWSGTGGVDFNDDGIADLILGAPGLNTAYCVFGSPFFGLDQTSDMIGKNTIGVDEII